MISTVQFLAISIGILAGFIIGNIVPLLVMDWLDARERHRRRGIPFYSGPMPVYPNPAGY